MTIYAQVIADSISHDGARVTTIEAEMPRFVLAEFNTHRAFSRNSASSRAVPVAKQVQRVREDPVLPIEYRYNQAGMQAGALMSEEDAERAETIILSLRHHAAFAAEHLAALGPNNPETGKPLGLHKQWANRYLEPWMWHRVIVTSCEWENFFAQRCTPDDPEKQGLAQPEMQAVANAIRDAMQMSTPKLVEPGDWHTPYVYEDDLSNADRLRVSAARCARVSFLTHDGRRDISEDLKLFRKLATADPMHASPMEHVCTPFPKESWRLVPGNLTGWWQLRHLVENGDFE